MKHKLIRVTTVPISLKILLQGQHKFMSQNNFEVIGIASNGLALHEVSQNEDIRVLAITLTRKISPIKDFYAIIKLCWLFNKEKPTIVHSHTPKAGFVSMIAAKLMNVPIRLHTVAGLPLMETNGWRKFLLIFVEKLVYKCATNVYPNSNGLLDYIIENRFVESKKLKVIANGSSNGIDTFYFSVDRISELQKKELRIHLNLKDSDIVLIFVGRLVGDKGINELVSAFISLNDLNIKLLLVGELETDLDPLEDDTTEEILKNPNIISVGFQNDVRPYFAISHCLVLPSYREGFPNVVMQAGAMGLPCIVTDINGCNEIIINGENGLLVPKRNTDALKNSIEKILLDRDLLIKLQKNARQSIKSRFEQKTVWKAILTEYTRVLKERNLD
jgi:glycosyltransferase involved in cell wall biosynthesis